MAWNVIWATPITTSVAEAIAKPGRRRARGAGGDEDPAATGSVMGGRPWTTSAA